jgi:hypothetical protein
MSPISELPVQALQTALAAEHAAVWGYGLASAFLPPQSDDKLTEGSAAHRARRDATERMLRDAGVAPVPAAPGYLTPQPVTDVASAVAMVTTLETDAAVAWRSVVERSPADPAIRSAALDALTGAAVRATRWRGAVRNDRLTVPFPGLP